MAPFVKMATPKVGDIVPVHIPGETLRARVTRIIDPHKIVVAFDVMAPFTRGHGYHKGDVVVCVVDPNAMIQSWEATKEAAPEDA